jgi:hypothetical protein
LIQAGCKLPDSSLPDLPPNTNETGMWYVGMLNTSGDARYVKGFIIGAVQYAFLADGQKGLEIIDLSNPQNPSLILNYATNGFAREVYIDSISANKYIFLSDENKGLFIFNTTNPSTTYLDTLIAYTGGANSSYLMNGYLYVALRQGPVKILNLNSLPDSVYEVNTFNPQQSTEHIEISGTKMYLLQSNNGFEIIDITDPVTPVHLSSYNTPGNCYNLKIGNDIAYIADGTSGVSAVNVGNPSQPQLLSTTNTNSDVRGIDYSPNFMFTAEYNMGAEVFNLFNPVYPEAFGYYETSGYCYSVNYFKGKVLIANGQNGLLILRF